MRLHASGCPIRKSTHQRVFAPTHGLSQLVTSFFASESQGILHVPFSPFLNIIKQSPFRSELLRLFSSLLHHRLPALARELGALVFFLFFDLLVIYLRIFRFSASNMSMCSFSSGEFYLIGSLALAHQSFSLFKWRITDSNR